MNAMVRIFSLIKEYFHSEKNEAFYCTMRIMETFIHHDIIIIRDGAKGGGGGGGGAAPKSSGIGKIRIWIGRKKLKYLSDTNQKLRMIAKMW
jgi:hypothetical protein